MSNPPSARIVTPDAPVNEVKKAQTSAVTIAGPSLPVACRVPDEPQGDQSEPDGQHQFNHPYGNVVREAATPLFFRQEKLDARHAKERADGRRDAVAHDARRGFDSAFQKTAECGKRKKPAIAGRNRPAEHADDQRE